MSHKAGFISIIGYPNVGKSTLMNAIIGENLSVITPKAQTTRHRILGIHNGKDHQMIFSDTPGILDPKYALHKAMLSSVMASLDDADIILVVTEPALPFIHSQILPRLKKSKIPLIVLINKIDTINQTLLEKEVETWAGILPAADILPVSARYKGNLDLLLKRMITLLPEHPKYYSEDELTDRNERFFVSEIIREKILLNYSEEIPYSVEVNVESFKEEDDITKIRAVIYISRESQKAIILGHEGKAIKKLGTDARKSIEDFLGRHTFLELHVKVAKNWRDDELQLKRFGYGLEERDKEREERRGEEREERRGEERD